MGGDERHVPFGRPVGPWVRLLTVLVGLRMVAVPVTPLLSNDSIGYLRRARDLAGPGWVEQGYRQIGYPLWQWFAELPRHLLGWDRLFSIAAGQRLVLAGGSLGLLWVHGLWSLPILVYLTAETIVATSGLLITEGVTLGISAVFGALLGRVVLGDTDAARPLTRGTRFALLGTAAMLVVVLASIKFQFAAAWLPLAAVALDRRVVPGTWRQRAAVVAVPVVLVGALAAVQSFENRAELGVFEPVSERARASWYGAWQAVFVAEPGNRDDPALAAWYDDGDLYTFLHGLEASEPNYTVRAAVIEDRIEALFEAAGTSEIEQQISAFGGALVGGRTDDVAHLVERLATTEPGQLDRLLVSNFLGRDGGVEAIEAQLNDGRDVGAVVAQPLRSALAPLPGNHTRFRAAFAVLSMVALGASIGLPRHRWLALATLGMYVGTAAAVATSYIDNARYLIGATVILSSMATAVLPDLWIAARRLLPATSDRTS